MKTDIAVSLLIPVFNTEKFLSECLDSACSQTLKKIEIICVNDGSTDSSGEILRAYKEKDKRIVLIEKENGGLPSARNAALDRARGEYVAFLDSDDYLSKDALENVYKKAKHAHADVVVFGATVTDSSSANDWLLGVLSPRDVFYDEFTPNVLFRERGARPFLWRNLVKRELLERERLRLRPDLVVGEDQAFQFRFFPRAKGILFCSDKPYFYRTDRADSIMANVRRDVVGRVSDHAKLVDYVFSDAKKDGVFQREEKEFWAWGTGLLFPDLLRLSQNERIEAAKKVLFVFEKHGWRSFEGYADAEMKRIVEYAYLSARAKPETVRISVIVDASNADERLERFRRKVESQVEYRYEILLFDSDKSEWASEKAIRYATEDTRVRLLFGEGKTRYERFNKGIKNASGTYLIFCSARDYPVDAFAFSRFFSKGGDVIFPRKALSGEDGLSLSAFAIKSDFCEQNKLSFWEKGGVAAQTLFMLRASYAGEVYESGAERLFVTCSDEEYTEPIESLACFSETLQEAIRGGKEEIAKKIVQEISGEKFEDAILSYARDESIGMKAKYEIMYTLLKISETVNTFFGDKEENAFLPIVGKFAKERETFGGEREEKGGKKKGL